MDKKEQKSIRRVVVSDIDNTLLEPMPDETLKELKSDLADPRTKVGILSARPKFLIKVALIRMDIEPDFSFSAFMEDKSRYLKVIKKKFPGASQYIYIGNSESDQEEAEKAGFEFKSG